MIQVMTASAPTLPPRLLYVGDVPVESSYHGSALLYRLLQNYPAERLRVIEAGRSQSLASRRLAGVVYESLQFGHARILNSRCRRWYSLWLSFRSTAAARRISPLLRDFEPEAVLSVAHGYLWVTAAEFAKRHNLPFHLIVHDDWPRMEHLPKPAAERVDNQFGRVYRGAASRLCVSPFMRDFYTERYGAVGEVLYPSRAAGGRQFLGVPPQMTRTNEGLAVAFAGTINSLGYARILVELAECLLQRNGVLLMFGPHDQKYLAACGLIQPNVRFGGLLASHDLVYRLRHEADVLFVPMSFEGVGHQENMRLGFPSKLADYTSTGAALLICGPSYCSAVRWAREHAPIAEVVVSESRADLGAALDRLAVPGHRIALAERAMDVGHSLFSQERAEHILLGSLKCDVGRVASMA
jgi:glycosyltransferase involved in cell wall biosynthesis